MKYSYIFVICLGLLSVMPSKALPTVTRPEIEQEIKSHQSSLQEYILKKLEYLLELKDTNDQNAKSGINSLVSALEDLPLTQLDIAHKTLDILKMGGLEEIPDPLRQTIKSKYPAIKKYIFNFEENILTEKERPFTDALFHFNQFSEDQLKHAPLQAGGMSIDDLAKLKTTDVLEEYKALNQHNFMEDAASSAVALYSILWAIKETPHLAVKFEQSVLTNIKKDDHGNYYLIVHDKVNKFSPEDLSNLNKRLHPSSSLLVKLLGLYTIEKMGIRTPENYHLTEPSTGHDYFFGNHTMTSGNNIVVESDISHIKNFKVEPNITVLNNDGTLVTNMNNTITKISGNFVLAVSIGGGHGTAVAIYYNSTQRKWKLFNSINVGLEDMKKGAIINAAGVNLVQIMGDFSASKNL